MFLKFRPLLQSFIFIFGLEFILFRPDSFMLVMIFLLMVSAYGSRKIGGRWFFSVLPIFFTFSSLALLYLITLEFEQQIFIALASVMYYLSLLGAYRLGIYAGDKTARGMNMAAMAATIFFTCAGAYGLYLNFFVPLYYLMLVYLIVTLLVSYQYFSIIQSDNKKRAWTYSFLLALVMTELIWTMNFWPFGYLTTGVIALILYYVLWDLVQSYFLNILSKKRVVANMIFFSVLTVIVLLSAKWLPVV
ncbi:MAG: hypothetical protein COX30_00330 [Candidatus Moranbacteria bacterium CG23_combo_of_CG06-09_8_20_14_all_39_10]|nr:MAG: hypothetical protein COX30_00330 [Candidatus Moranbacteria bacterium CG23_combo_of_CG06-09_8_20_14_all_39_10]